jgi:hypothetical protein
VEDLRWEIFKSWLWSEWLEPERDTPHAVLTLRRIAEFEQYAEDDVAELRELKDLLRTRTDSHSKAVLREIARFEETEEPWGLLAHFKVWLKEQVGGDANAHLTGWWISKFETMEAIPSDEYLLSHTLH